MYLTSCFSPPASNPLCLPCYALWMCDCFREINNCLLPVLHLSNVRSQAYCSLASLKCTNSTLKSDGINKKKEVFPTKMWKNINYQPFKQMVKTVHIRLLEANVCMYTSLVKTLLFQGLLICIFLTFLCRFKILQLQFHWYACLQGKTSYTCMCWFYNPDWFLERQLQREALYLDFLENRRSQFTCIHSYQFPNARVPFLTETSQIFIC